MPEIRIFKNEIELGRAAAGEFLGAAREAMQSRGRFNVALSGGNGPRELFRNLARAKGALEWGQVHFFWGDERLVPPDDPQSNYGAARKLFLSALEIPEAGLHRVKGEESNAERAAEIYAREIRVFFGLPDGAFPEFDLVLLGLGSDGHVASLFPGSPALQEAEQIAVPSFHQARKEWRVTLTPPVFNQAARVMFLVFGPEKAGCLLETLRGQPRPELYPAQLIHPQSKEVLWMVDEAAASAIK